MGILLQQQGEGNISSNTREYMMINIINANTNKISVGCCNIEYYEFQQLQKATKQKQFNQDDLFMVFIVFKCIKC